MIQKMIDQIVEKQVQDNMIDLEEKNIYRYGYVLVFETVLNIILAVTIGAVTESLGLVFFFLCSYIPLRSFCGGWHADKIWKCTFVSNVILIAEVLCVKYISYYIDIWIWLLVFLFDLVLIIFLAPVETRTKKISKIEKKAYKKRIYIILVIHLIIVVTLTVLKLHSYIFVISYVYSVQIIMLLLEKLRYKS